jgi:hypothetical protein
MPVTTPSFSALRRRSARRVLGALALALQALVLSSAIWEPQPAARLGVHVEQPGTRHVGMHDEASCTVCAVRSLHAPPADRAEPLWRLVPPPTTADVMVGTVQSRDDTDPGLSRAPPASV